MKKYQIKAFTLVELIIVITILAILRTIGFMSFQTYTGDSRDGKRKTDLSEIRKGLEIYQTKNQILPTPDEQLLTVKTGSLVISYQGYLGKEIQKTLRLTSEIKDPKDNNYYTYSTNGTQTKYELLAMLENNPNITTYKEIKDNIITEANAGLDYINRYTYSLGSKVGIFLTGTTNAPLQETLTGVDLNGNTNTYKVIFSNTTNSGTISSSGTRLYQEIINNQGTGGTAIQTNSCTTQPSYTNAIFTIGTPTTINQAWQNTNSGNPCYWTCATGYINVSNVCTKIGSTNTAPGLSCKDILDQGASVGDGIYWIDPDGATVTISPFQIYCDMTTDLGGWTQLWNETNNSNFDYSKFSGLKWNKLRWVSNSKWAEFDIPTIKTIGVDWNDLGNPIYKSYALGSSTLNCTSSLNLFLSSDGKSIGFIVYYGGNVRNKLIIETRNYYSQIGTYTNTCNGTNPGGTWESFNSSTGIPTIFKVYIK